MNNSKKDSNYYDEIFLKEIIISLWKRRVMIVSITLIFAIITGMISFFVLSPVYDTKLNIVINMPETYNTRYGNYQLPISTNDQYINLIKSNDVLINTTRDMGYDGNEITIEDLRENISVGLYENKSGTVQNSFEVIVSAENPEESLKLAETLFNNYIEFIDIMTKERAISYYNNTFKVQIKTLENQIKNYKEILGKNEELLADTPQIIASGKANLEIQTNLTENSNYIVPIDAINPNYIKIENDIVGNRQSIAASESAINMYNQYLDELNEEGKAISNYYKNGQVEKLETTIIGIVENCIYLPSQPVVPIDKSSPNNTLNTLIGAVIGCIVGVMSAFVKEYWF